MKKISFFEDEAFYLFECPHCNAMIQVMKDEVNCSIFRHGILKSNGQQINPHSPKDYCEDLIKLELANGCCMPFRLLKGSTDLYEYVEICDWI